MMQLGSATNAMVLLGCTAYKCEKKRMVILIEECSHMKALVSAFALLTFVAGIALPSQSHAQATISGGQKVAQDTTTPSAPATSTKKKRSSKSHHAKKRSRKPSTAQTS